MNKKWHIQNVLNSKPLLIQPNLKSRKEKKDLFTQPHWK